MDALSSRAEAVPIVLPKPRTDSNFAIERALEARRTRRDFRAGTLTLDQLGQLLWAAQGITQRDGLRSAPSAGALYPLAVYVVVGEVRQLPAAIYRYLPAEHALVAHVPGERRAKLAEAALRQDWIAQAAVTFVIVANERRTTRKYGTRGLRYVHIEVGHAAQNLLLQATALGLGSAVVGAFHDDSVGKLLNLPAGESPLYIIPVGERQEG
jgi:SagB-type dehydrogenase family enzyme